MEQKVKWWNELSYERRRELVQEYQESKPKGKQDLSDTRVSQFTEKEIHLMWRVYNEQLTK